jgi:hypothetical protein
MRPMERRISLASDMLDMPRNMHPLLCAFLTDCRVVRPVKWQTRLALWFVRLTHGNTIRLWTSLEKNKPGSCTAFVAIFAERVLLNRGVSDGDLIRLEHVLTTIAPLVQEPAGRC